MPGKPMKVALLSQSGEHIGWAEVKAANGSWRVLGAVPRINVPGRKGGPMRDLERYGDGWAYRMRADGYKPRKTWPLETVKTGG